MDTTSPVPPVAFKDRKTGLLVFGVLLLIAGALCLLFVSSMFLSQMMTVKIGGAETTWRMILPSVITYLFLAVIFIALGVGSMKAKRWARALALVIGWSWLVVGVFTMAVSFPLMFHIFKAAPNGQELPREAVFVGVVVALIMLSILFVIVPGVLVLFYGRKDVKATCEARDPVVRWTDRIPLPLLALVFWIGFGALMMLFMPFAYNGVIPLFGKIISGLPGSMITLAVAALWGYAAWAIFKLKPHGWWIVFFVLLIFGISSILTFRNIEIRELYLDMGYPAAQAEQMEKMTAFNNKMLSQYMVFVMLPFFGFLIWAKRFFPKSDRPKAQ